MPEDNGIAGEEAAERLGDALLAHANSQSVLVESCATGCGTKKEGFGLLSHYGDLIENLVQTLTKRPEAGHR